MIDIKTGMLAKSKAGHDKDKVYIIWKVEGAYVYLVDGVLKTTEHPKKKRKIHVQPISRRYNISEADNVKIKEIIKNYMKQRDTEHKEDYHVKS